MFYNCIYVMLGGAVGALLRFLVAQACAHVRVLTLPVGTFIVNLLGCLFLGVLTGIAEHHPTLPRPVMLMLSVGVCGAFTTFSTFSAETIKAAEAGQVWQAFGYVVASLSFGFLLFWWGKHVV